MKTSKIKALFDTECAHLTIDAKLIKRINDMRIGFTTRNAEHIEFFGGNLTGVNVVRFTPSDAMTWFEDILEVNEAQLERKLHALDVVNKNFNVISSLINNTLFWMTHRILTAPNLAPKQKEQGSMDTILLLMYRFFTSRLYRHFKYPADREVATAVYASLSRKYDIKVAGNWNNYFNIRAAKTLAFNGLHYHTLMTMDDDIAGVGYALNDIQGGIRKMLVNIAGIHYDMSRKNIRIGTSSQVMEYEGEHILKDQTKSIANYTQYLQSIVGERNAFIKKELTDLISQKVITTMPERYFIMTLEYIVKQSRTQAIGPINKLISDIIVHAINYLFSNKQMVRNTKDLSLILTKLKGTYTSSRNSDPVLLNLRKTVEDLVKKVTKINHQGNIASTRTGVLLYFILRAFTMNHYK